MKQKELTKTVMMILNWKETFGSQGFHKTNLALYGLKC